MISGCGYNTNPHDALWFCHFCNWSGVLPADVPHVCKTSSGGSNSPSPEGRSGAPGAGREGAGQPAKQDQSGPLPSPYCRLYLARRQMEEIERALVVRAEGKAKSNNAWKALAHVREALR